jgi:hypothetical protein
VSFRSSRERANQLSKRDHRAFADSKTPRATCHPKLPLSEYNTQIRLREYSFDVQRESAQVVACGTRNAYQVPPAPSEDLIGGAAIIPEHFLVLLRNSSDVIENRGPWFFAPMASLITSGGRLPLAMAEASVMVHGCTLIRIRSL